MKWEGKATHEQTLNFRTERNCRKRNINGQDWNRIASRQFYDTRHDNGQPSVSLFVMLSCFVSLCSSAFLFHALCYWLYPRSLYFCQGCQLGDTFVTRQCGNRHRSAIGKRKPLAGSDAHATVIRLTSESTKGSKSQGRPYN